MGNIIQQKYWLRIYLAGLSISLLLIISGWGIPQKALAAGPYYVAPTGNDTTGDGSIGTPWQTIQKAANTLTAGDTVYIRAGIYQEQVIAQNSGSAGNYITFAAYPGEIVTIDGASISLPNWDTGLIEVDTKSYIKISGLRIINAGPNFNNAGILVNNSDHIIIENNYTYNTVSSGIGVWDGNNITIDNNEVRLANNDGEQEMITVSGTDTFEVKNNHVHDGGPGTNGGEGITIKGGATNGKIYKNHVNDITQGQRTCLYVDGWGDAKATANIEIYQNTFHNCAAGITLSSEDGSLVRDIKIYNNIVYGSQSNGLEIGNWGEPGISVRPIQNVTFINNTVYNNGSTGWGSGFFNENPNVTNIIVRNNIFSQNLTSQIVNESTASLTVDYNLINGTQEYAYAMNGSNDVTGDPKFVNPGIDFHLQNNSPAIDAGSAIAAPNDDFEGNSRPQDGDGNGTAIHDIGAYEVTPSFSLSSTTDPQPVQATTPVITYTITLQNNGGLEATGVTITSTIPNSTSYKSGGDSFVDPNIVWNNLAVMSNSLINVSFQLSVTAEITDGDQLINAILVSSAEGITASLAPNIVTVGGLRSIYLPVILRNN